MGLSTGKLPFIASSPPVQRCHGRMAESDDADWTLPIHHCLWNLAQDAPTAALQSGKVG